MLYKSEGSGLHLPVATSEGDKIGFAKLLGSYGLLLTISGHNFRGDRKTV